MERLFQTHSNIFANIKYHVEEVFNLNKKIFLLALFTVVLWGSGFAGIRASLLGGFSSGHLVLFRFLVASLVFIIYAILPGAHFSLPKKEDLLKILVLGWIGITTYHVAITFGQQTVSAGTAAMIIGTAPIFTTLIAVFFLKERMEWFGWLGLFIGFIGTFLITLGTAGTGFSIEVGAYLVLIAAISAAIFFVFQKPLFTKYHPIELTAYFTWAGTLPMLIFTPGLLQDITNATLSANLSAIYVGIFPAAIAYVTWAIALSEGKASTVTSMMYLEPVVAIIIAWFWLNEWPSLLSLIGGFIAVSSVAIVNILGSKKRGYTG